MQFADPPPRTRQSLPTRNKIEPVLWEGGSSRPCDGVYDMTRNESYAWVSVGCDHDTPAFAVASIRRCGGSGWVGELDTPDATGPPCSSPPTPEFEYINATHVPVPAAQATVISVDTKKKASSRTLGGNGNQRASRKRCSPTAWGATTIRPPSPSRRFASGGSGWVGEPTRTRRPCSSRAGSNGYWKLELQQFADESHLRVRVSHFPPGTSKWNKIEHRLFCHITENWRGKPLTTFETIVDLIGHTRTAAGLRVKAKLDTRTYPTGVPVSRAQMDTIALLPDTFHGEWNYELLPR